MGAELQDIGSSREPKLLIFYDAQLSYTIYMAFYYLPF